MQIKKIVAGTSAVALSLSFSSVAWALDTSDTINLEVDVEDTLSMDCFELGQATSDTSIALSDTTTGAGTVVAGTPSVGASTCEVTTNAAQGYYLTIEKTTENVTWADDGGQGSGVTTGNTVLTHEDPSNDGVWFNIPDKAPYTYQAGTAAGSTWSGTGLGFSVVNFPDTTLSNNDFENVWVEGTIGNDACLDGSAVTGGATDNALYTGVPDAAQTIAAVPEYTSGTTTTNVCYKVDVAPTQQSGEYAGQVTFTAVTDASAYVK